MWQKSVTNSSIITAVSLKHPQPYHPQRCLDSL